MIGKLAAKAFLGLQGWKPEGEIPPFDKCVMIAAPHTSNWDLPFTLYISYEMGIPVRWMGKKEIFRYGPWGWWMRHLGGLPVDRSKKNNLVQQCVEMFESHDKLVLLVPPEGTRKGGGDTWRSGFYHIAHAAKVPIVLGFLDYSRKRGGLGPAIMPTGDIAADMERIRNFYSADMAKYPALFRLPRLRDEVRPDASAEHGDGPGGRTDAVVQEGS